MVAPCTYSMHRPVTSWGDHMVAACTYCMGPKFQVCLEYTFTPATLISIDVYRCCGIHNKLRNRAEYFFKHDCLSIPQISKEYRLLKFCSVPATSATSSKAFSFFLVQPLKELTKETRHVVRTIKQSILLRCLWSIYCKGIDS